MVIVGLGGNGEAEGIVLIGNKGKRRILATEYAAIKVGSLHFGHLDRHNLCAD